MKPITNTRITTDVPRGAFFWTAVLGKGIATAGLDAGLARLEAGTRSVSVVGARSVSVMGTRPADVEGTRPADVVGTRTDGVAA